MDENKLRFGVGVLVISAIGIGIILTFLFGAFPSVLQREYSLSVVFPSAEGISVNTPVFRDGVRIGRVASIKLRDKGGVLVTLSMDANQKLTHRYLPRIGYGNLVTGDAQLEFVRTDPADLPAIFRDIIDQPYNDGEYLDKGTKVDSMLEMQNDLQTTFKAIRSAGDAVAQASQSIKDLANEARDTVGGTDAKLDTVSDQVVASLEKFQAAMRDIQAIVGDPKMKADLETSLAKLPETLDKVQSAFDSGKQTFETFEQVGEQFQQVGVEAQEAVVSAKTTIESARRSVENIEQFTEPLAENGDQLVAQVMRTLTRAEGSLAEIETFASALNNNNGSLRRFLEDEELYWRIRRTVENIENATARVRPILDDVRIFTDKIARDPRQLGVKGALSKRPSGLGLK